ncbi:UDP-N-acetylglucosamine 1-carboxyvinyltransferase [Patescibacteria group bacterium]
METFIVKGGKPLVGRITLSGAKNVALKACVASLLTDDEIVIDNVPLIQDVVLMMDLISCLGVKCKVSNHKAKFHFVYNNKYQVPIEIGARLRTSSLILGPMLARFGKAVIPNPGGCRIGARPINRHIHALEKMGAKVDYSSQDGYFYASCKKLKGAIIEFEKNTHTGTEAVLLAAVLASGRTVIKNAANELEVDDLICLLNNMGAQIVRSNDREITIDGVDRLHGTHHRIMSDRNEEVTFAVAAALTNGRIIVNKSQRENIKYFLEMFKKAGGIVRKISDEVTQYSSKKVIHPTDIVVEPHPGFMTDWQAPWALLMTQAEGVSTIHETVFESRFSYVEELRKMGAKIEFFNPKVANPKSFYNFNWRDRDEDSHQAIRIVGKTKLHNAVIKMSDLRAGATLLLAALSATGESYIHQVDQIDRGYENVDARFAKLGASIKRISKKGGLL